ncbi:MAG: enoyl-CoA hydratase-related protein [Bacteroidota bacterium]
MDQVIRLEEKKGVGHIILERPKANSYEINFMKQLLACLQEVERRHSIRIVVLRSALEKFFSAGADIKIFQSNTVEQNKLLVRHARQVAAALSKGKKITIAAINGHALGGGLELAMACDIRLGSDASYFLGLPEIKLGLIPGNGGSQRLIRLCNNRTRALELLLTGNTFGYQEALDLGLFSHVYPKDSFAKDIMEYAEQMANGPLEAMTAIKTCVNKGVELSLEEGLALEDHLVAPLYASQDAKEGFQAFLEKREPRFK